MSDSNGIDTGDSERSDDHGANCLYCMDQGIVKRRYGTVGPGPAKIIKTIDCPLCGGSP